MSTTYRPNWRSPYLIVKGVDNALTFDVLNAAAAQQTATVGTIGIYRGAAKTAVIADGAAATGLGPPATYTLLAATTSALTIDPDERWDVRWVLTIGGTAYKFRRPGWLTEYDLWPQIVDQDLYDAEPELAYFVTSGGSLANLQTQVVDAWDRLLYDLYRRQIRAHLITDGGTLAWPHIARTIANLYGMARYGADSVYADKAQEWRDKYEASLAYPFPIDADASGAADEQEQSAADGPWPHGPTRPRVW